MEFSSVFYLFFFLIINFSQAWDADDLALFDVIEDVNQNFYELLEVDQSASSSEIRRAYRRVSLQLHPDKNKDPDAENQFRKLVAAYEVLKDEKMRVRYDEILVTGLPDWRQPVYYYRKVRKMGLIESSILISIILTVGHFLVSWSIYLEKKFVYEHLNRSKKRKDRKSRKQKTEESEKDTAVSAEVDQFVPKPRLSDLFPVLIVKGLCWLLSRTPDLFHHFLESVKSSRNNLDTGDDEGDEEGDDGDLVKTRQRKPRIANQFTYEMAEPAEIHSPNKLDNVARSSENDESFKMNSWENSANLKPGEWTESEIELLVKAVVKFPGGTTERWEKISAMVGRSVKEVTSMSKKLKTNNQPAMSELNTKVITKRTVDNLLKNVELTTAEADNNTATMLPTVAKQSKPPISVTNPIPNSRQIEKTPIPKQQLTTKSTTSSLTQSSSSSSSWTQQQQKLLETAMVQVAKDTSDRWDKIAELVLGRTKEECLQRVRYLAEMVKKRKSNQQEQQTTSTEMTPEVDS